MPILGKEITMLLQIRFLLLATVLAFYSNNSIASSLCWNDVKSSYSNNSIASPPCWTDVKSSNTTPRYFILAMGANTGHLKKANDDAKAFAEAMLERFPLAIHCVIPNVTFSDFKAALECLQQVRKQDKVFIYFSGHGTTQADEDQDETNCLDEVFVTHPSHTPGVTDDKFVKWVNRINTDHIITVIDTCFASGMLRGEKGCPKQAKPKYWFNAKTSNDLPSRVCRLQKPLKQLKGILYAASEEDKNAWEYPNKGGIFTSIFLENMKKYPDDNLDQIFDKTQKQVKNKTKNTACQQRPQRWPKISFK